MALGFGHESWVGFASESTWGTRVAPSKFLRITEESLKLDQSRIARPSLGVTSQNRSVKSKKAVNGGITVQGSYNGLETLLKHAFGGVNTTLAEASVYDHAYSLTNALPTGLTLHVNRDAANIGTAYEYEGCMIEKLTISQSVEDFAQFKFEFQGEDEAAFAVATPTFPTFVGMDWEQLTVNVNSVNIKPISWEMVIENPLASDRYQMGNRARKGLGRSAVRKITGKIDAEYDSSANYDLFKNLTTATIQTTWQGPVLGSGFYQFDLQVNAQIMVERNVSDAGPISASISYEAFSTSDAGNNEVILAVLRNSVASAA
jgi:hypothetical protein